MNRTCLALALVAAAALVAGSCKTAPELPPLSTQPTNQVTPGRVVWHDLVTQDVEAAKRFYGGLFGWTFADYELKGGRYALASLDGKPVAGILEPGRREVNTSQWISYFSVESVEDAAAVGAANGAELVVPPRDLAGRGRAALLVDPEGAPVAIARLKGGDPAPAPPPLNSWLWVDLWTRDPTTSSSFYQRLLGLAPRVVDLMGKPHTVLARGDKPYAGMIPLPQPDIRPNWLPIVRVKNVAAAVERAAQLGGRVLLAPSPEIRGGKAAIVADPSGGGVAVHEWDVEASAHSARQEKER